MSKQEFLTKFDNHFAPLLAGRKKTFRAVFDALGEEILIVETGTLRTPGNWAGDGQSTVLFDEYCKATDSRLYSIDINPVSTEAARPFVSSRTTLITEHSILFLRRMEEPIDLLYLDSLDGNFPNTAEHMLEEFTTAQHCLKPGSIVFIDDISTKGRLIIPHLNGLATAIAADEVQIAWRMP
jgi:predicted O-methyltransferase YrrM